MASRVLPSLITISGFDNGFTISLSNDGTVYSFGSNERGVYGHKEKKVFPHRMISSLKHITAIDCTGSHSICLDIEGVVFTFGSNSYGQLGIGKTSRKVLYAYEPQKVIEIPPIKQISCGEEFSMCLSETGDIYAFGKNTAGQLGIGNNRRTFCFPQKIELLENVDFVDCGEAFTYCKCINGDIFCWGKNDFGQLSSGNTEDRKIPGKCIDWPEDVIDIKCDSANILVLTLKQEVYSCGSNYHGQLGRTTDYESYKSLQKIESLSDIIRIEVGLNQSKCVDINGNLFFFGTNAMGSFGIDLEEVREPTPSPTLHNVLDISGGHSMLVKTSDNEIFASGDNRYLQLGKDTNSPYQKVPVRVLEGHEDIWCSNIFKPSKAKSARSISKRPNKDISSPSKKQKKN